MYRVSFRIFEQHYKIQMFRFINNNDAVVSNLFLSSLTRKNVLWFTYFWVCLQKFLWVHSSSFMFRVLFRFFKQHYKIQMFCFMNIYDVIVTFWSSFVISPFVKRSPSPDQSWAELVILSENPPSRAATHPTII